MGIIASPNVIAPRSTELLLGVPNDCGDTPVFGLYVDEAAEPSVLVSIAEPRYRVVDAALHFGESELCRLESVLSTTCSDNYTVYDQVVDEFNRMYPDRYIPRTVKMPEYSRAKENKS